MQDPQYCPECDCINTERVWQDFENYQVIEVRICNDCGAEYQVTYGDPIIETTHAPED